MGIRTYICLQIVINEKLKDSNALILREVKFQGPIGHHREDGSIRRSVCDSKFLHSGHKKTKKATLLIPGCNRLLFPQIPRIVLKTIPPAESNLALVSTNLLILKPLKEKSLSLTFYFDVLPFFPFQPSNASIEVKLALFKRHFQVMTQRGYVNLIGKRLLQSNISGNRNIISILFKYPSDKTSYQ